MTLSAKEVRQLLGEAYGRLSKAQVLLQDATREHNGAYKALTRLRALVEHEEGEAPQGSQP